MPDLSTLSDAFAELERAADALPDRPVGRAASRPRHRSAGRVVLVAATVALVAGLAVAVALTGGDDRRPAGSAGSAVTPAPPSATSSAAPSATSSPSSAASTSVVTSELPGTAAELAARLRAVLGRSATFTYAAPAGSGEPVIAGVLTNRANGRSGGFDLQTAPAPPGERPICEDADTSHCVTTRLPSGAYVAVGHEPVEGGGVLYLVSLVRRNGGSLLLHVSTTRDPKGGGGLLSRQPPFTSAQLVAIVNSPRW